MACRIAAPGLVTVSLRRSTTWTRAAPPDPVSLGFPEVYIPCLCVEGEWCFGENIELEKKRQRGRNEGEGEILTPSGKERDGNAFPITINPLG
eukprot:superscaffoldBa00007762_g22805